MSWPSWLLSALSFVRDVFCIGLSLSYLSVQSSGTKIYPLNSNKVLEFTSVMARSSVTHKLLKSPD
jgi:hypothetical protein